MATSETHLSSFSELAPGRRDALALVFTTYDGDRDGYLDLHDVRLIGWALSGRRRLPNDTEAALQLQRADADGDGRLSLSDWLRYAIVLSRMSEDDFRVLVQLCLESYKAAVEAGLTSVAAPS